jgi:PucR C-terminal helix-turn-helix domain
VGVASGNRVDSGDGARDDLEVVRSTLLARLRPRAAEVRDAMVAAALKIEPRRAEDPEGLAGLTAAATATVELIEELIAQGKDWQPRLPEAVREHARYLARNGATLDAVMRGHYATTSVCLEFATAEIAELPAGTLPYLIEIQGEHGDYLMGAVSAAFEEELARLGRSPGARRLGERVERLLAGGPAEAGGLDYDLGAWHLGLIAVGPDAEPTMRRLSERLGARLLLVPRSAETAWAWLGSARPVDFHDLERSLEAIGATTSLASGEAREGIDGWRLTHREARTAAEVTRLRPRPLTHCAEVVLLAATLRDEELARMLVDIYLGPLAARRDGEALRATLRAYYATCCNAASAAAALGVDRQTVRRRLRKVEGVLGRDLDGCRPEMEMALRVEEHARPKA